MVINDFIKKNKYLLVLAFLSFVFAFVNIRMNVFSYNNFDFGKFDLGNMSQMLWNTLHGKFMYLTDYFGTNLPRWAMSHVDPIILLFLPIFYFFPHPLTLVFSQVILLSLASLVVYKIARLELQSDFLAFSVGVAYLAYPALGFVTAKTTFHGVSVAVFFFFVTFYLFEKIYQSNSTKKVDWVLAWIFLIITMAGKEQIALYLFFFGL